MSQIRRRIHCAMTSLDKVVQSVSEQVFYSLYSINVYYRQLEPVAVNLLNLCDLKYFHARVDVC